MSQNKAPSGQSVSTNLEDLNDEDSEQIRFKIQDKELGATSGGKTNTIHLCKVQIQSLHSHCTVVI